MNTYSIMKMNLNESVPAIRSKSYLHPRLFLSPSGDPPKFTVSASYTIFRNKDKGKTS